MPNMSFSSRNHTSYFFVAILFLLWVCRGHTTGRNCPDGFSGPSCETSIDLGTPQTEEEIHDNSCHLQCEQGSYCVVGENGEQGCECPTGRLCTKDSLLVLGESRQLECNPPCQGSSVCQLGATGEMECSCPPGLSGASSTCDEPLTTVSTERLVQESSVAPAECDLPCEDDTSCIVQENGVMACEAQTDQPMQAPTTIPSSPSPSTLSPTSMALLDNGSNKTECSLPCRNGGNCVLDSSGREPTCSCRPGYTGDLCESIIEERCGLDTCYHGSQCVASSNGDLYCDCRTIGDPMRHYAGQFCQFEATLYCPNREYYCFNGGRCKEEGLGKYSCLCPQEWTGPSCEFESQQLPSDEDDIKEVKECNMVCLNGGKCHKGAKDFSVAEGVSQGIENLMEETSSQTTEALERCVCPQGYTGRHCEHSYQECGNGEHMCLHGSVCVPPKDMNHRWTCECDEGSGSTCNRHTSTECTSPDTHKSVYRGLESLILCVNDGVCTTYSQDGRVFPACKCPPRYTGPHCEFLRGGLEESGSPIVKSHESVAGVIIGLLVSGAVITFMVLMIYRRTKGRRSRRKTAMIEFAHIQEHAERSPAMEEVEFEDAMEEVELL